MTQFIELTIWDSSSKVIVNLDEIKSIETVEEGCFIVMEQSRKFRSTSYGVRIKESYEVIKLLFAHLHEFYSI